MSSWKQKAVKWLPETEGLRGLGRIGQGYKIILNVSSLNILIKRKRMSNSILVSKTHLYVLPIRNL
jgi:hypothetical protein